jgi:prepilin-type N-terminal cleavage/methylation domain-containing protein
MKKLSSRIRSPGFTIVELLIVIVVIGILAAITIVAYNGAQARAEKAKIVSAASNAIGALSAYQAINGNYPSTATVCLGSGYGDHTGDGNPDCRWNSGNVNPSASFSTTLATVAPFNAPITQSQVTSGNAAVIGIYFMNDSLGKLDGNSQQNWLVYAVADKSCGMTVPLLTGTYPQFTTKSNDTVSENWGSGGLCWVPLP